MLRKYFPYTNDGASLYDGFLPRKNLFCKIYEGIGTFSETINEINLFLEKNGYRKALAEEFDESATYFKQPVTIAPCGALNQLLLSIERDITALSQTEFLINELKKFRVERDWDQFHNPKDLSIALSIEANELLEQFLWKKPENADPEKVANELADVFAYAFQLADRLQLDVEKILLRKIKHNGEKYPVAKSKGSASKYNEL
jgi:NTP pyrophosphatase (non-canonical NTP hydrolase)